MLLSNWEASSGEPDLALYFTCIRPANFWTLESVIYLWIESSRRRWSKIPAAPVVCRGGLGGNSGPMWHLPYLTHSPGLYLLLPHRRVFNVHTILYFFAIIPFISCIERSSSKWRRQTGFSPAAWVLPYRSTLPPWKSEISASFLHLTMVTSLKYSYYLYIELGVKWNTYS